jgi:hypothetical protein
VPKTTLTSSLDKFLPWNITCGVCKISYLSVSRSCSHYLCNSLSLNI